MESKLLLTTLLVGLLAFSGIPGGNYAQAASTSAKTDAERKKYLEEQKRKIDKQSERQTDRVLDGQKGLGNSGSSQKKIAEIERERDARKKALDDHYKQGSQRDVVGLDGKRKNPTPAPSTAAKTSRVSVDGKLSTMPKTPQYVVGVDGKRKLKNP